VCGQISWQSGDALHTLNMRTPDQIVTTFYDLCDIKQSK